MRYGNVSTSGAYFFNYQYLSWESTYDLVASIAADKNLLNRFIFLSDRLIFFCIKKGKNVNKKFFSLRHKENVKKDGWWHNSCNLSVIHTAHLFWYPFFAAELANHPFEPPLILRFL